MHRTRLIILFVSWLTAAPLMAQPATPAPAKTADGSVDLRPHFVAGRVSRYSVWTARDQAVTLNFNGQVREAATSAEFTGEVTWSVDRVKPDGAATCSMTLDWLSATLTGADGTSATNDSRRATGDSELMHKTLRAMAGVPIKIEVAADGTILSAAGADAVARRIGAPDSPGIPDERDYMETANDLATVAGAVAQAVIGQGWDAAFAWNHEAGTLRQQMRYTLASLEEIAGIPVATVTGSSTVKLEPDLSKLPKTSPDGGPPPKIDIRLLSGSAKTQVMLDLQRHEAVGRNTVQETVIDTKMRRDAVSIGQTVRETIQSQALRIEER